MQDSLDHGTGSLVVARTFTGKIGAALLGALANANLYQILFAENNPSPLFDYPDLLLEQLDKAQALVAMAMDDCFYDKPRGSQHLYLSNVDDAIYLSKVILSQWRKLMKSVLPKESEEA